MKIEDIIKALKDADIAADIVSAVEGLDTSAEVTRLEGELEAEQGKSKGILEDKKRYKAERDTHKAALDKIETDKLPTEEQHAKAIKEMQDKLDAEKAERETVAANYAKEKRELRLSDIAATVNFANGVPNSTAKLIIKNAFDGMEDLSDESKVSDVLNGIKDTHKTLIAAEVPSGSGGKGAAVVVAVLTNQALRLLTIRNHFGAINNNK